MAVETLTVQSAGRAGAILTEQSIKKNGCGLCMRGKGRRRGLAHISAFVMQQIEQQLIVRRRISSSKLSCGIPPNGIMPVLEQLLPLRRRNGCSCFLVGPDIAQTVNYVEHVPPDIRIIFIEIWKDLAQHLCPDRSSIFEALKGNKRMTPEVDLGLGRGILQQDRAGFGPANVAEEQET